MVKDDVEILNWSDSLLQSLNLNANLFGELSPSLINVLDLINVQLA